MPEANAHPLKITPYCLLRLPFTSANLASSAKRVKMTPGLIDGSRTDAMETMEIASNGIEASAVNDVVVVGAGPAGLMLA